MAIGDVDTPMTEDISPADVPDILHSVPLITTNMNVTVSLVKCLLVTPFRN